MALRNILQEGDSALRKVAREVTVFDAKLHSLLDDMKETMDNADGVGLAAPQIGIGRQICIIDVGEGLVELINPEILSQSGEQINSEGCLSILGVHGYVKRPQSVVARAQNRNGKWITYHAEDFFATAICHETDHLVGILFRDKILDLSEEELAALKKRDEVDEQKEEQEQETK